MIEIKTKKGGQKNISSLEVTTFKKMLKRQDEYADEKYAYQKLI